MGVSNRLGPNGAFLPALFSWFQKDVSVRECTEFGRASLRGAGGQMAVGGALTAGYMSARLYAKRLDFICIHSHSKGIKVICYFLAQSVRRAAVHVGRRGHTE